MSEKKILIDGLELHYEGMFDLNEFLKAIDKFTAEKGYGKSEKRRQEAISTSEKEFSMELRPTKAKTEYYSLMIKIRIHITNIRDVTVVKNKLKTKMQKGDVSMIFDTWTTTDFEMRWERSPIYYFLRMVFIKFIWRVSTEKWDSEGIDDTHAIYDNIKAHLNLYRY